MIQTFQETYHYISAKSPFLSAFIVSAGVRLRLEEEIHSLDCCADMNVNIVAKTYVYFHRLAAYKIKRKAHTEILNVAIHN